MRGAIERLEVAVHAERAVGLLDRPRRHKKRSRSRIIPRRTRRDRPAATIAFPGCAPPPWALMCDAFGVDIPITSCFQRQRTVHPYHPRFQSSSQKCELLKNSRKGSRSRNVYGSRSDDPRRSLRAFPIRGSMNRRGSRMGYRSRVAAVGDRRTANPVRLSPDRGLVVSPQPPRACYVQRD